MILKGTANIDMNTGLQGAFRALSDPTRRHILLKLSEGDMSIGQVVDQFDMTRAAVRKHLTILEEGQLITVYPKGRERFNRLDPVALKSAAEWFNYFGKFWDTRLDSLKLAVEQDTKIETKGKMGESNDSCKHSKSQ